MADKKKNPTAREIKAAKKAAKATAAPVTEAAPKAKATATVEGKLPPLPKMPSAGRKRAPKPMQPCKCGCGTQTTGTWAPGHDARAKGWALRIERGICKISDVPENEQAGAKFMLKVRKDMQASGNMPESKIKLAPKPVAKAEAEVEAVAPAVNE